MLKMIDYPNPETKITEQMFFIGKYETSEPVSIPPARLKGVTIVAVARRGEKNFFLTKDDLAGFIPSKKLGSIPKWLLSCGASPITEV